MQTTASHLENNYFLKYILYENNKLNQLDLEHTIWYEIMVNLIKAKEDKSKSIFAFCLLNGNDLR